MKVLFFPLQTPPKGSINYNGVNDNKNILHQHSFFYLLKYSYIPSYGTVTSLWGDEGRDYSSM